MTKIPESVIGRIEEQEEFTFKGKKTKKLLKACLYGKISDVEEFTKKRVLLGPKVDVNSIGDSGLTFLNAAVEGGQIEIVKLLIERSADVNLKNMRDGDTPLMTAAGTDHREIVEILLNKGADVNRKNNEGCTILMNALKHSNLEIASLLIQKGADVNAKDPEGFTALMFASSLIAPLDRCSELIENLKGKGANFAAQNNSRWTALELAANRNNENMVKAIARALGDPVYEDLECNSDLLRFKPFMEDWIAAVAPYKDCWSQNLDDDTKGHFSRWLQKEDDARNDSLDDLLLRIPRTHLSQFLFFLIIKDLSETAKKLLDRGADVNIRDEFGNTPLIVAAMEGSSRFVETLLAHGADGSIKNKFGFTAQDLLHLCYKRLSYLDLRNKYGFDIRQPKNKTIEEIMRVLEKGEKSKPC